MKRAGGGSPRCPTNRCQKNVTWGSPLSVFKNEIYHLAPLIPSHGAFVCFADTAPQLSSHDRMHDSPSTSGHPVIRNWREPEDMSGLAPLYRSDHITTKHSTRRCTVAFIRNNYNVRFSAACTLKPTRSRSHGIPTLVKATAINHVTIPSLRDRCSRECRVP